MEYFPTLLNDFITIEKIYSVHYFCYTKNFEYAGESHNFYEFVFADSGEVTIENGNQKIILFQGEAFIHPKNIFHNIRPNGNFANIAIISFDCDNLPQIDGRVVALDSGSKELIKTVLQESKQCFAEPLNLVVLEKMTKRQDTPLGAEQVIKNCFELLLINITRSLAAPKNQANVSDSSYRANVAENIVWILSKNVNKTLTLKSIADSVGYSVPYIKKVFKDIKNSGIIAYFLNLKIEEAKKLISQDYSFSQITEILSLDSVQYFSRLFKKTTSMTPSQYKKSVKLLKLL